MTGSPLASPSATLAVLQRHGLYTKKSLGQHFLIDDNVIKRIIQLARVDKGDGVLEIGPGIGTLTLALCDVAGSVVTVERDGTLLPVLAETTAQCHGLTVVHADAVSVPFDMLADERGVLPGSMVANLPYAVAATVILRFFEGMTALRSATVMVQAEVADRIAAQPSTKAYGAYTVKLGLRAKVSERFAVPRSCFLPPPRVDSAVIRLERVDSPGPPEIVAAASRAADAAFAHRRKTIRNSLRGALGAGADVDGILDAAGVDGGVRAETLTVADYVRLGLEMHAQGL